MTENDSGFFFSPETLEDLYNAALWGGRNDILLDYLHFRHLTGQLPDWLRRTAKGLQDQHGVENALPLNIDKKEAIVRAAIRIFIEKGCADTSIADIVAEAAIGRGTFYVFFKNKDEIFIDSAERLFFDLYADVWQEVKDERNIVLRLRKRAWSFLVTYPRWADAMNLLRGASVSPNYAFGEKYRQIVRQITTPLVREIQKGVEQGVIRPINPTLAAHLLLGVVDYCGYLHQLGRYNEI